MPVMGWACDLCLTGCATYFGPDPVAFEQGDQSRVRLCDGCYERRLALVPDEDDAAAERGR